MYDGALEKEEEKKRGRWDVLKKNLVLNDLSAPLLPLAEDTAEVFKGAFQDTCISLIVIKERRREW